LGPTTAAPAAAPAAASNIPLIAGVASGAVVLGLAALALALFARRRTARRVELQEAQNGALVITGAQASDNLKV
jgi:hypothetical protein